MKYSCLTPERVRAWGKICLYGTTVFVLVMFGAFLGPAPAEAERRPPSASRLRICSQNLFLFASKDRKARRRRAKQKSFLVSRMKRARCDVIALQELVGESEPEARTHLDELVASLQARTGRKFSGYLGGTNDAYLRNAFIVAADVGSVKLVDSFYDRPLPRLQPLGPPRRYSRGPLGVLLDLKASSRWRLMNRAPKEVFAVTFHFKSKADAWKDSTMTQFETARMEMAEGLRGDFLEYLAQRTKPGSRGDIVPIVLGDRNSEPGSPSAYLLEGARRLSDYAKTELCQVALKKRSYCVGTKAYPPVLLGLFDYRRALDPERYRGGSFRYKKRLLLIDEILVRPDDRALFQRANGTHAIGFEGAFYKGSDHMLLWAELDLNSRARVP